MVNDPIADFLTRIRNAQIRGKKEVSIPNSNLLFSVAELLKQNNYLADISIVDGENEVQKSMLITLKYRNGKPAIMHLKRISKPGLREYLSYREIPKVLNGKGIAIISTPKGVMTGDQAKNEQVGGEYLCEIW